MRGHVDQWKRHGPDVIAVQEATLACLRSLFEDEWLKSNYRASCQLDSPADQHGLVVFSTLEFSVQRLPLPGSMGRKLLWVGLPQCQLAVVHLESNFNSGPVRAAQIEACTRAFGEGKDVLWLGDFNFCATSAENAAIPESFADLWLKHEVERPGWTIDTEKNAMLLKLRRRPEQKRYDRVLLRGQTWQSRSIELVGQQPLREGLFASDHFGLFCHLEVQG